MKIVIDKKTFELNFGFKCLRKLGDALGVKSYSETIEALSILDNLTENVTFEQSDLIEALIQSAAEAHPDYDALGFTIHDVSLTDFIFTQPDQLLKVMQAFIDSLQQTVGKQPASKPVRKTKKKSA